MSAGNQPPLNRKAIRLVVITTLLVVSLLPASRLSASSVNAPAFLTWVGGAITSDTTWTDTYYYVASNVRVMPGVTLTIGHPGVWISFAPGTGLQVDGTLVARGTDGGPITFTRASYERRSDWKNIEFTDSSMDATFDELGNYTGGSILEHCIVEYAGGGVEAAIQTDLASPIIDHCTVRNSEGGGIWAVGTRDSPVVIRHNVISNNLAGRRGGMDVTFGAVISNTISNNSAAGQNGGGIRALHSTVRGNTVSSNSANCGGGIYAIDSTVTDNIVSSNSAIGDSNAADAFGAGIYASNSTVTGNTVRDNSIVNNSYSDFRYGGGIYAEGSSVVENRVSNNRASNGGGIYAEGSTVTNNDVMGNNWAFWGGGIYARYSSLIGNTVSGNSSGMDGGGIHAESSTMAGNIISGNYVGGGWSEAGGGGGIYARDSTMTDNIVSGNSAAGGVDLGKGGCYSFSGGGIYAQGGTVTGNTISNNSVLNNAGCGWGGGGILAAASTMMSNTITGNSATGGGGIKGGGVVMGSTPQFQHNNLYGNVNYDVVLYSSGDINGTENFWGTVAAADIESHIYDGNEDAARGKLLYVPYLQDLDPDAPVPPPQGLRADFIGNAIRLSWDAIPSTTSVYGYKVYYGTDASGPPYQGTGALEGDSPIDVGGATHFTLSGLGSGGIHIAVTAHDAQGRESWYSNEAVGLWRVYLPSVKTNSQ